MGCVRLPKEHPTLAYGKNIRLLHTVLNNYAGQVKVSLHGVKRVWPIIRQRETSSNGRLPRPGTCVLSIESPYAFSSMPGSDGASVFARKVEVNQLGSVAVGKTRK